MFALMKVSTSWFARREALNRMIKFYFYLFAEITMAVEDTKEPTLDVFLNDLEG